jgi:hypothetical protein
LRGNTQRANIHPASARFEWLVQTGLFIAVSGEDPEIGAEILKTTVIAFI